MQRMGHQCFPRTRFPINQDMAIGLCDIQNIFAQPLHRVGFAHQLFHQLRAIGQFAAQRTIVQG